MKGYVILKLIGDDIRNAGVRARFFLRVIGPKGAADKGKVERAFKSSPPVVR